MSSPAALRSVTPARLAAAQRRSSRLRWAGVLLAVVGAHFIGYTLPALELLMQPSKIGRATVSTLAIMKRP